MCGTTIIGDFRNYVPSSDCRRKERKRAAMSDHSHFEELAALEASGFLSSDEQIELRNHVGGCADCLEAQEEFRLIRFGLPLTIGPVRQFIDKVRVRPDSGMRSRFLQRARLEGLVFSPDVEGP